MSKILRNELLFDSEFLAKLEQIRLASRRLHRGQFRAERRSQRTGSSMEFADYRTYAPGDDPRKIDWNAYGRLDRLFLKLFEEEEEIDVHLLVDASASMRWGPEQGVQTQPATKFDFARKLAAAFAFVGLAGLDRVDICYFSDRLGESMGLSRGRSQFARALRFLSAENRTHEAAKSTQLERVGRDLARRARRRGLVIVLSDFLDPFAPLGYEKGLGHLIHAGFDLDLVQVIDPLEMHPKLKGDLRLQDSETGETLDVAVNSAMQQACRVAFEKFRLDLRTWARRMGAGYVEAVIDVPFEQVVLQRLRAGGVTE